MTDNKNPYSSNPYRRTERISQKELESQKPSHPPLSFTGSIQPHDSSDEHMPLGLVSSDLTEVSESSQSVILISDIQGSVRSDRIEKLLQAEKSYAFIDTSFRLTDQTDRAILHAIAESPMQDGEAILAYMPNEILANSQVCDTLRSIMSDPRLYWGNYPFIADRLKGKNGFLRQAEFQNAADNRFLLAVTAVPVEYFNTARTQQYKPFARITHIPNSQNQPDLYRMLMLKHYFFWREDALEERDIPHVSYRVLQAFAEFTDLESVMHCLFPGMHIEDFFSTNPETGPVYHMVCRRLKEIAVSVSDTGQNVFFESLLRAFETMTPQKVISPTMNVAGRGMSLFQLLHDQAVDLYNELRDETPYDLEMEYRKREMNEWGIMTRIPSKYIMSEEIRSLSKNMTGWVSCLRKLNCLLTKGFISSYLKYQPEMEMVSLDECESFSQLLQRFDEYRKFSMVMIDPHPRTNKPMLTIYQDRQLLRK